MPVPPLMWTRFISWFLPTLQNTQNALIEIMTKIPLGPLYWNLVVKPKKPASWTVLELDRKKPVNCPKGKSPSWVFGRYRTNYLRENSKLWDTKKTTIHHFPPHPLLLLFFMGGRRMAEATGKMTQLCRKIVRVNIRVRILDRVTIFQKFFRFIWDRIIVCSIGKPIRYHRLSRRSPPPSPSPETIESGLQSDDPSTAAGDSDSDLVSLKICVMGDCQIGKTSFLVSSNHTFTHSHTNKMMS